MLSIDTNIPLHGFNKDSPRHKTASRWLESIAQDEDVAISELILAEFYSLLRNPAVLKHPLLANLKARVRAAQMKAAVAVNRELMRLL
jgi:predicted nucleic acid-binding protein